jgi:hypothetical protein
MKKLIDNFREEAHKTKNKTEKEFKETKVIYWHSLELTLQVVELLITENDNPKIANGVKKYDQCCLLILNRCIQHLESIRTLIHHGLYGDSFVLMRSVLSDLNMMQYLHFRPDLLDLFLHETIDDYQKNKDFKNVFTEKVIEDELIRQGLPSLKDGFQFLSKASHTSSFGAQLYCTKDHNSHFHYPKFEPVFEFEKALLLSDVISTVHLDLVDIILNHRHLNSLTLDSQEWKTLIMSRENLMIKSQAISKRNNASLQILWPDPPESFEK